MNVSELFIRRPVATTLLAIGLFLVGAVAYWLLPVASMPSVDLPVIRVSASRPGADPATMAASVAAPLERRLGEIAGVTELTSQSTLGTSTITIQFDIGRKVDKAANDVQAALNGAATDLPSDLPTLPNFRKANPSASPVMLIALTSDTIPAASIYDAADTVIAQRISQVDGVAEVTVSGAEQPAIRVRLDRDRLSAMGLSLDKVRTAIVNANALNPLGAFSGSAQGMTIGTNDQLNGPASYGRIVVRAENGTIVRLQDIATVERGVRNSRAAGSFNGKPAVILQITKQPDANVVQTVDRVRALLPELGRWLPPGIDVTVMNDRSVTIRASIREMQWTLMETICLVMMVVFLFLRRGTPTIAAGITVPLSLAGTFACMWLAGFTLDNLSLMAITVSVGFVVDDAIVMIENVHRSLERGMSRLDSAIAGARQIGFTVFSISLSLIAAFIPLFFMPGIIGRFFKEFSYTLAFSIAVSTVVSLTVAPTILAHFGRPTPPNRFDRIAESFLGWLTRGYGRTLKLALRHEWLMLAVTVLTIVMTVHLFRVIPKGYLPQDDSGLIMAQTEAAPDISFPAMADLQEEVARRVIADPSVAGVSSSAGSSGFSGSVNQGRLFISLKDGDRPPVRDVIQRLRRSLSGLPGIRVYMMAAQDMRGGARSGKGDYQFTLWGSDLADLESWTPRVLARLRQVDGLQDVATDREQGGLQATVQVDRTAASRLGVAIQDIDTALNNAFSQRQVSTIYSQRNQYRVVLEVGADARRDPSDLTRIYVPGSGSTQVPLSAIATVTRGTAPLMINHQGSFPSITITYNLAPGTGIQAGTQSVLDAVGELHLPDSIHAEFAGDAKDFGSSSGTGSQGILILAALLAVYIILGVLYESLAHPLTILSTLPSAGLGALIALMVTGYELTIIALIGVVLLIGLVKKNGIMLVDFALEVERRGHPPAEAVVEAAIERFRPILMTTLAALLGAVPLAIAWGVGSEIRRPLGITIIGGLLMSQVLTLYTTPAIYLLLSRFHRWSSVRDDRGRPGAVAGVPAE